MTANRDVVCVHSTGHVVETTTDMLPDNGYTLACEECGQSFWSPNARLLALGLATCLASHNMEREILNGTSSIVEPVGILAAPA